jgi:hypothetical protein
MPSVHAVDGPPPVMAAGKGGLPAFEDVVSRLAAASEVAVQVGLPTDPSWLALPETLEAVPRWHVERTVGVGDRRAAALSLGGGIVEVPTRSVAVPVLFGAPVPGLEIDDLHVRPHPEGWFEALAVYPLGIERVHGDPLVAAAAAVHRLTAPLVAVLTNQLPVGRQALWGGVADALGRYTLHLAHATGVDPAAAWDRAMALLDALEPRLDVPLVRPTPLLVPWSGGLRRHQTRGTCCLHHRTCDAPIDGDGSCTTCPLRSPESRVERLAAWLERTAAGGAEPVS